MFGLAGLLSGMTIVGCGSSGGVVGSGNGSHVPQPVGGDFSVFLKHDGSTAQLTALLNQNTAAATQQGSVDSASGRVRDLVAAVENGVLIIRLGKHTTPNEKLEVFRMFSTASVVDHVEPCGCDVHPLECRGWTSTAGMS
jgi:hypothetical protein